MTPDGTRPVPLATVGGFLGAGKTTLVNHLLSQSHGERIVVFVNDFGAINIDYDLIEAADTDRVSLKNGCVCCTLNDDLIASIVGFCREDPPHAFVIEASGVSDPRSLDQSILALQAAGHVRLNKRIYVLDAERFGSLDYADTESLIDHAAASDLVLINKTDLVSDSALEKLTAVLARATKDTLVRGTVRCQVPIQSILDEQVPPGPWATAGMPPETGPMRSHADRYCSWSRTLEGALKREAFDAFLREIAGTALRAKGRVVFDDDPRRMSSFDLVGARVSTKPVGTRLPGEASKLVVIGRRGELNPEALEASLVRCLA